MCMHIICVVHCVLYQHYALVYIIAHAVQIRIRHFKFKNIVSSIIYKQNKVCNSSLFKLIFMSYTHSPSFTTFIFSFFGTAGCWYSWESHQLGTLHRTTPGLYLFYVEEKKRSRLGPLFHRPPEKISTMLTH